MEIIKAFTDNDLHTPITIRGTHDNPLFRASDIGTVLDIPYIHTNISHMDETERVILSTKTNGGNQNVSYLTEVGLYTVLFRSNKPIAKTFRSWVCNVIKEIRINGRYDLEEENRQIKERNRLIEEENKLLLQQGDAVNDNTPKIYIYNIDTRKNPAELKIGFTTTSIQSRIKPFKQTCKFGKIEMVIPIHNANIRNVEGMFHTFFQDFHLKDEVFLMDVEFAKSEITILTRMFKSHGNTNEAERDLQSRRMLDYSNKVYTNENTNSSTREMSVQTDTVFDDPITQPILYGNPELIAKFESFVATHCIIHQDAEVSAKRIVGQYRLHAREAKREITAAFTDYLKRRFKFDRLRRQDRDQVVYGFSGVSLKPIEYVRPVPAEDIHRFVFEKCRFIPEGTAIHKDIVSAYEEWKRELAIPLTGQECVEVRGYLKSCPYTLFETVWSSKGGGQGYYGIHLTRELLVPPSRTSSTGCRVQKTNAANEVVSVFDTIAKAAQAEGVPPAKMSRWIKDKTVVNGHSYVKCLPSIGVDTP